MAIDKVTSAIMDLLANAQLNSGTQLKISLSSPDEDLGTSDLVLFLYVVTPAPDLRNAERVRPFPSATDPAVTLEPAVPLELHFLVTVGQGAPAGFKGLDRLAAAIRAIEEASPLAVPEAFQAAVWLSLLPLSSDEMARIWGLFPNENCRSSFAFRASPVWIDPLEAPAVAPPVTDDQASARRILENAA